MKISNYYKILIVMVFCLTSVTANAQWKRFIPIVIGKGVIDYARNRHSNSTGLTAGYDYRRIKRATDTGMVSPITRGVTLPSQSYRFGSSRINSKAYLLPTVIYNNYQKTYMEGMKLLEKGDTAGAISCLEKIQYNLPVVRGILGQLQCMYYGKEKHFEASHNLIYASSIGDTQAARFLGMAYLEGNYSFIQSDDMALRIFDLGTAHGDTICRIKRDMLLIYKDSVDTENAFPFWKIEYRKAVTDKDEDMLNDLTLHLAYMGIHLYEEATTKDDKEEAWKYIMEAASRNEPHASLFASIIYCDGDDYISQDLDSMYAYIKNAANAGLTEAKLIMARASYESQDFESCIHYANDEVFADSIEVQKMLADSYCSLKQYDAAAICCKKLEESGDTSTYYTLYEVYDRMHMKEKADEYLLKAAENGNCEACYFMAITLYYAEEPDIDGTVYWLEKASEMNDAGALAFLGDIYSDKKLKRVDKKLAADYYRRSAELGSYKGTYCYARCLEKGYGVKKNKKLAQQYYELAEKIMNRMLDDMMK